MQCRVITASRSPRIADGLTYETKEPVQPGTHVHVPLRKDLTEGIVLEILERKEEEHYTLREVRRVLPPLLTEAQVMTLRWMADHYCCSLRQALSALLPPPPWSKLLSSTRSHKQRGTSNAQIPTIPPNLQRLCEEVQRESRPSLLLSGSSRERLLLEVRLALETIEQREGEVLFLVPEIIDLPQIQEAYAPFLPLEKIALLHSNLTMLERRKVWQRIHRGDVPLVLGTRSALFFPFQNLRLVIIEEEQEWTYKSEKAPRYHARDTAEVLCRESHSKLVLGTGTPSLEAWAKVKGGQFHLATLDAGFSQPRVDVIDLTAATPSALYPFTPPLVEAIRERLAKHEQIILFLNRRGLASALLCFECRRRLLSPESQLPYTLHEDDSGKQLLVDHTTGITAPIPARCPSCGGADLRPIGAGTQRIERIVHSLFPSARLLRADRDVLHHPREMQRLLAAMERGEADILIGTQTVLKGLSLPRVTLAAVIVSDIGLSLPDFRAGERVFQCLCRLSQWSAESARRQVLIQTFCPLSPEISFGAQGAIEAYLDQELCVRFSTGYPPAEQMVRIILRGENTPQRAKILSAHVQEVTRKRGTSVKVSCAPTFFGGGRIWQVLLRGSDLQKVLKELDLTGVSIDVDPIECL